MDILVTETDLAWLASFTEAEGSISFQTTIRKNGNLVIVPFVRITNSSKSAIDEILRICEELDIPAKAYWRKPEHCVNVPICNIRIDGCYSVYRFLEKVYPYLITEKKHNADVLKDFIMRRKNGFLTRNNKGQIIRNGYTKEEVSMISSIRHHFRAKPLEELLQCNNIVA